MICHLNVNLSVTIEKPENIIQRFYLKILLQYAPFAGQSGLVEWFMFPNDLLNKSDVRNYTFCSISQWERCIRLWRYPNELLLLVSVLLSKESRIFLELFQMLY